ncbi:sensor histidine kinase [Glutamicibacter endophyticus]|uniref:sensor histidine kinase n=1 Tax=Glutamicibacter endophyticus TaxID=1522174 RepID=UPI003AF13C6C
MALRLLTRRRLLRAAVTAAVFVLDLAIWGGDTDTFTGGHAPLVLVVSIGALGYLPLAWPRSPLPGYLSMLCISLATLALPSVQNMAGFLMALFLMARLGDRLAARLALAGSVVPITVTTYTGSFFYEDSDALFVAINLALWAVLALAVWLSGRALAHTAQRLVTERRWAEDARVEATAMERLRISRDLHDSVAHSLTGILLQVAGLRAVLRTGRTDVDVDAVLAEIQATGEQSMRELHRLLGMLRESATEPGEDLQHGVGELQELIHAARASGLQVSNEVEGTAQALDPSISHAAYRVVQEGLSNAMKHAGDGAQVHLHITWRTDQLILTLSSVSGTPTAGAVSGGYGLLGLRERLGVLGGHLQAGATADGYLLSATLPIEGRTRPADPSAMEDEQ